MRFATSFRFSLALFSVLGLAPPAHAKVPSPANCTLPRVLLLVGRDQDGVEDPIGEFRVVLRFLSNDPLPGDYLTLDFTSCTDARLSTDQSPTASADCPDRVVTSTEASDATGAVSMRVVGHADRGAVPAVGQALKVFADGVLIGNIRLAILDLDGGGLGPSDLSAWLADFFSANPPARSDFDGDGAVGPSDLSIWVQAFFAGGSSQGGTMASCP